MGLQVVGRHLLREPVPWTEEIARVLLVWLMCVGGIKALLAGEHPRVTALLRLLAPERQAAVDRGMSLVLLAFFLSLVAPAWRLTVRSADERLPASGLSGAVISVVLPVALLLMAAVLASQARSAPAARPGAALRPWPGRWARPASPWPPCSSRWSPTPRRSSSWPSASS